MRLLPEGKTPEGVFEIHAEPLTDKEIERALVSATAEPTSLLGDEDMEDLRISLAGAQDKTALAARRS